MVTEAQFQAQIVEAAHLFGWRVAHFGAAQSAKGWRTPCRADGKGFFDLVLMREVVLFVECKTDTGKLTPEQEGWRQAALAAKHSAMVWRPSDWDVIVEILQRKPKSEEPDD